jgi:indole-3-glycerol phosphate synthase/phosphoribosylanthranilate isomerase
MPNILSDIVNHKMAEVEAAKKLASFESLRELARPGKNNFTEGLDQEPINLICEIKPKSPSAGQLRNELNLSQILQAYEPNAAAISVLTDHQDFGGSFDLLETVSQSSALPTLCKDFIIDPYQCFRARVCGAQAVLLIVKILDDRLLKELHDTILSLKMTPVVEVQNEAELKRAIDIKSNVVLINNRNLDTLVVDLAETKRLAPLLPDSVVKISASGIETRGDLDELLPYCNNFLIGSTLMRSHNIEEQLKKLKGQVTANSQKA